MRGSALLVIDVQNGVLEWEGLPPIHQPEHLLARVSNLTEAARVAGIPVIYVQHCAEPGQFLERDTKAWQIHPAVAPQDSDEVLLKKESSSFIGTNLRARLDELGVRTIIACGLQSEYCVTNTCVSALEDGLDVYLAEDGHSTRSTERKEAAQIINHQNTLLARLGSKVLPATEIIRLLGG